MSELRKAVKALKYFQAYGPNKHLVEFWKAVIDSAGDSGNEASKWLLVLCSRVLVGKVVPDAWRLQMVAFIYKKGDPGQCSNYKPICLLNAAYNIVAKIVLDRLVAAGADEKIWPSRFGFWKKSCAEDALLCI